MKNKTVLIMAAGLGSRFGGLKQIEAVGQNGEFLIDYSIYDAKQAGFTKIVFVIKEEHKEIFETTIANRIDNQIEIKYAYQKISDLPEGFELPEGREKPWGTAHAVLSARNVIKEPFIIINGDDYYGIDAYQKMAKFLDNLEPSSKYKYAMAGFHVENTMSKNGSVKRGICEVENGLLKDVIESSIENKKGIIEAVALNTGKKIIIKPNQNVSMNFFAVTPEIFKYIDNMFITFLEQNKNNPFNSEFFIPDVFDSMIKDSIATVTVIETTSKWMGITYKEDKELVVESLKDNKNYPNNLWNQ